EFTGCFWRNASWMYSRRVHRKLIRLLPLAAFALPLVLGAAGRVQTTDPTQDFVKQLVGRLDLEKYKATIKGLTAFGDRRQGTDRNRAAIDWIEEQLKSYGCPTERLKYEYNTRPQEAAPVPPATPTPPVIASGEVRRGVGGSRYRGITLPTGVNND